MWFNSTDYIIKWWKHPQGGYIKTQKHPEDVLAFSFFRLLLLWSVNWLPKNFSPVSTTFSFISAGRENLAIESFSIIFFFNYIMEKMYLEHVRTNSLTHVWLMFVQNIQKCICIGNWCVWAVAWLGQQGTRCRESSLV